MPTNIKGKGYDESLFVVKKSNIPNAGKGLFSTVSIEPNERVIQYRGVLRRRDDGHEDTKISHDYCFRVGEYCIDAYDKQYKARYVNDVNNTHNKINMYAMLDKRNRRIWYIACRKIRPGDELYISYGEEYWVSRGL